MKVSLLVEIPGPMHGKMIPITGPTFTIGRDPKCSLEAGNPAIAEQHCAVEIREDKVFVRDLQSVGGTFVNDVRIAEEIQVQHADRLKVGPLLFRLSIATDEIKSPPVGQGSNIKVFLVVQMPGPMHGQKIPITSPTFTIGRDPQCSLEAANPAIAEQHCALEIRDGKVILRDLESAGGTFVNDSRIAGEIQVRHGDRLKVGPLLFGVSIEIDQETSPGQKKKKKPAPSAENNASYAAQKLLLRYRRDRRG